MSKTILIVDDNIDTCKPMARLMTYFGHRGVYRTSGEEALSFLREERPDLMVLDVMMPGLDGIDVLRLIRNDPKTANIPVVLYSAIHDPDFRAQAMSKGATDYWVKTSLDMDEIKLRIEHLLQDRLPM